MEKIQKGFHRVLNKLNKISLGMGVVKALIEKENIGNMKEYELRKQLKKTLEVFSVSEKLIAESGAIIKDLRKEIYNTPKTDK